MNWKGFVLIGLMSYQRIFSDGFETIDPCDHTLVNPAGWQFVNRTWAQAWSSPDGVPQAVFPNSVGFPVPIPGAGIPKGSYAVIGFVPTINQTVSITWDTAQANPQQGYPAPRPANAMFIGISQCPGDFRTLPGPAFDACARMSGLDSLFWSTRANAGETVCRLQPMQTYFMTVAAADPTDGLTPGEHTCQDVPNSQGGCDVQAVHHGQ